MRKTAKAACAALALGAMMIPAGAAAAVAFPDFAPSPDVSWVAAQGGFKPPAAGPGPVQDAPGHPTVTNDDFRLTGKQPTFPVADLSNPILQPWVKEILAQRNAHVLDGNTGYGPRQSCWLVGTPAFLVAPVFRPMFFVQMPKEVLIIWQLDHQIRHIYLDVPHSQRVKPSYFGESVGHYEGDALVVDTIGINDRTFIDDYLTPHSGKLHVVERYRMTGGGKGLEVRIHVEDPGAFTMPWDAMQYFRRLEPGIDENENVVANDATTGRSPAGPLQEESCAENTISDLGDGALPVPRAEVPDF